jgi:hypothetical protein
LEREEKMQQQRRRQQQSMTRIDVIRSEHSWDDLNQTLKDWTGQYMTIDFDFFYFIRKPYEVDTVNESRFVTKQGLYQVCSALCHELVVYKKMIQYASNLNEKDKAESFEELDAMCGFDVDGICGTSYNPRRIKKRYEDRLCEPGGYLLGSTTTTSSTTTTNTNTTTATGGSTKVSIYPQC